MTQRALVRDSTTIPAVTPRAGRTWLRGLLALLLTGIFLTLAFPAFFLWPLAGIALVPWVVCLIRRPMNWRWMLTYYLFGAAWFMANLWWLCRVSPFGTVALSFYMAVYWMLFAWATRRLIVESRWPAVIAVPLVWVTCEYLRSTVMSGFPWFLLGNALAGKIVFIQIADLLGVWGVSFFAAATSGLIVDVLRLPLWRNGRANPTILRIAATWLLLTAAVVAYGIYRLGQHTQSPGPRVATVQGAIPEDIKSRPSDQQREETFRTFYTLSENAIAANKGGPKPDLVVWPETIIPDPINIEWLQVEKRLAQWHRELTDVGVADIARAQGYDRRLAELAKQTNTRLLVGSGSYVQETPDRMTRQNLAILYTPEDGQTEPYYAKRHLVPFGEVVPFGESWPWLHHMLLILTPMDEDYTLEPGREWTRFTVTEPDGTTYHFGTPICYEDVMPYPSRDFVAPVDGKKSVDFLATITNDNWYLSRDELEQHLQMTQMRAVENRVPFVRSVNGGASGFIDSNGQVGELVRDHTGNTYFTPGYAVATLLVDSRITLYSRIGDLFPILCGGLAAIAVGWTIVRPRLGGRKGASVIVENKHSNEK